MTSLMGPNDVIANLCITYHYIFFSHKSGRIADLRRVQIMLIGNLIQHVIGTKPKIAYIV